MFLNLAQARLLKVPFAVIGQPFGRNVVVWHLRCSRGVRASARVADDYRFWFKEPRIESDTCPRPSHAAIDSYRGICVRLRVLKLILSTVLRTF
jgi:hypothetical protein